MHHAVGRTPVQTHNNHARATSEQRHTKAPSPIPNPRHPRLVLTTLYILSIAEMAQPQMYQDFKDFDQEWKRKNKKGIKGARPMGVRNYPRSPSPVRLAADAAPAQPDDPAPVTQAHQRTRIPRCVWYSIAVAMVTLLVCVCTLVARSDLPTPAEHLPTPAEHLPPPSPHTLNVWLDADVNLPGLQCVAARLGPLGETVSGLSHNHELLPNVTDTLKALSDAEQQLVSRLLTVHTELAETGERLEAIHAVSEEPKLGFLARVSAVRRLLTLVARITEVRRRIMDLQAEISRQKDRFIPAMQSMVETLCSSIEEHALADVYAEIWGGPGHIDLPGGAQHTLVFRGFCASAKSTHASRYGRGPPLQADELASELQSKATKLDLNAEEDLNEFHKGCGVFCKVACYLYRPADGT